jgi:LPS export ABC transporter protein LptC
VATSLTKKQSLWLGVGLLAVFFIGSAVTISFRSSRSIPVSASGLTKESVEGLTVTSPSPPTDGSAGFVLNDFHRSLVRDGKTVWEIFGTKGRYSPATGSAEVEKPNLTLSTKEGDTATLTAGRAVLELSGADLSKADLFDDVVVHYKDKTTLKTSKAIYTKANNSVLVPVYVEIENDVMFISGETLTADLETRHFTMEGGVKSVIKPRVK